MNKVPLMRGTDMPKAFSCDVILSHVKYNDFSGEGEALESFAIFVIGDSKSNVMKFSVIVPVYNRPDEVKELLGSLSSQGYRDFEVIIVEDGSKVPCGDVVSAFTDDLDIRYFIKDNSGPGQSRNFGAERAKGEYLIILDSDVIVPPGYFFEIEKELSRAGTDAFGGPDRAHDSFTPVQKAISYSMTSFFTTGGIRGGKVKMDKFYPRSFNMGVRRDVYAALGGFSAMRFGEDIDFSIRIFKGGYKCRLFPQAWVYHKRRTDFRKFFKQVHNSGIARINLFKKYPESLKLVHLLPAVFTVGVILLILLSFFRWWFLLPLALYALLVFADSFAKYILHENSFKDSLKIGGLSIIAAFVQLIGYGTGFLRAWFERCVLGKGEVEAFKKNFYK